ncbi:unnamed protein product [Adineta steineri]|uniref:Uncharacterized protein n=1 Tax=Adineta steineri TaxID=433720 RepID=A0A815DEX4_9BILA|nr:unnamed protein product [Adineta steineri]
MNNKILFDQLLTNLKIFLEFMNFQILVETGRYTSGFNYSIIVTYNGINNTIQNEEAEFGSYGLIDSRIEVDLKINREGKVNRVCYMPQNPRIIA